MGIVTVADMVPCGLNDCVRIQNYVAGSLFSRHRDQNIKQADGKISKYSLRVFLNSLDAMPFEGGFSVFHLSSQCEPVVVEPEARLVMRHPEDDWCTTQEKTTVISDHEYLLQPGVFFS